MAGTSPPAIVCRDVGKKFSASLRRGVLYGLADIARGVLAMRVPTEQLRPSEFWAVDGVTFELQPGEMVGLVGSNGAGKSTLLKLLNGVFPPDRGEITIRGRVAAIIELGAGFHPMLSGLDNIFINAAVLGISRTETTEKLPNIIDFAGIPERFIEAPLKMYSSGMKARLGFAVASQLDPDVLLIDEVLAVGDLAFQEKCMRRMDDLRSQHKAIVFVTHSLYQVEALCDRAIWLEQGCIVRLGTAREVVTAFLDSQEEKAREESRQEGRSIFHGRSTEATRAYINARAQSSRREDQALEVPLEEAAQPLEICNVSLLDKDGVERDEFPFRSALTVRLVYRARKPLRDPLFNLRFLHQGRGLFEAGMLIDGYNLGVVDGAGTLECHIPELPLTPNFYEILLFVRSADGIANLTRMRTSAGFRVTDGAVLQSGSHGPMALTHLRTGAPFVVPYEWRVPRLDNGSGPLSQNGK